MIYRFLKDTRGVSAVMFGLTLPIAIGFLGLGSETALWFYKQRELQKIVDIAAYNGAVELSDSDDPTLAKDTAVKDAIFHGFDASTGVLTVNTPPKSGAFKNANSVEVMITGTYPPLFSALFRDDPYVIAARAVASFRPDGTACILSLHPDASRAIDIAGGADVELIGCSVMSNSIADDSFYQDGTSSITTPCVRAVGGISYTAGLTLAGANHCDEPWPYSPAADDPFEDLPAPSIPSTCSLLPTAKDAKGVIQVPAARYCGGFNLLGSTHYNFTTGQGAVHIIDGGTFRANANTVVTGTGVTFYLTNDADILWNGTADIDLTAPTEGTYEGVLFFADRDPNDDDPLTFDGTANSALIGAIYAPGREVTMNGDFVGSNGCTQLVASMIILNGNNSFSANCTGAGLGDISTAGRTRLVE